MVRLVRQQRNEQAAARRTIQRVADQIRVGVESPRTSVKRDDIDEGVEPGLTSAEAKRITGLEQESRELRRPSTRYREFSWSTCGRGASRS